MNYMQKLAKEYPDVKFEHATGYKTAPNMTNYSIRFYEGRYLAGKLAGRCNEEQHHRLCRSVPDS